MSGEDVIVFSAELGHGVDALAVDVTHGALEVSIDFLDAPAEPDGVLCHFEAGDGDAASVASDAWGVDDAVVGEVADGVVVDAHIE